MALIHPSQPNVPTPIGKDAFKETVRAYFEQIAPDLDRWSRRNRYYYQDLEHFHQFFIPVGSRVLEIGCGTGELLASLQPAVGVGIDFAAPIVEIARSKFPYLTFHCLDAETFAPKDLGFSFQPFDFIILSGTLGHLGDIQRVLQQLQPFCHARTRLILTFHNFLWQPILNVAEKIGQRRPQPPQSWLSMDDVENLLTITGYTTVKTGRRFLCPKPVPGLAPLCNRFLAHLPGITHLGLTNYIIARPQRLVPAHQASAEQSSLTCSVIIPARNEAGNIANIIDRLPKLGRHMEVIFVEGHSQDNTWKEIAYLSQQGHPNFKLKAYQQKGKGKADAVRLGFERAGGDILMILDADLTVEAEDLVHFFEVIASGRGEFANGSRLVYPRSGKAMPWLNNWANKFFSLAFSFLLGQPIKDTLCGTKVLRREDYYKIVEGRTYFGDFDPFGDFDLLFGATKLGLHIVDVPVRYQPRTYGESNIAHFQEGLVLLKMCLYASRKIKFF
ncbi:glycosyltransferase [Alkalinema pantanalense CENA528]|uniref:glycosyltransferase n=1 Tax=Alkalinema pantanalense TaxID=1620705 RepID=UPI003D6F742D